MNAKPKAHAEGDSRAAPVVGRSIVWVRLEMRAAMPTLKLWAEV